VRRPAAPYERLSSRRVRDALRQSLASALAFAKRDRHRVFLEIGFSRSAIAPCLRAYGYGCVSIRPRSCPALDLRSSVVRSTLLGWIRAGIVCGVVCRIDSSWSLHRCLGLRLAELRAKPNLTHDQSHQVRSGNALARFSVFLLSECARRRIACLMCAPKSSTFWHLSITLSQLARLDYQDVSLHLCRFGASSVLPLRVVGICCSDLSSLSLHCIRSRSHVCSTSNLPHLRIPHWVSWPLYFRESLARFLALSVEAIVTERLSRFL